MESGSNEIDLAQYQQASKFWIPDSKTRWQAAVVFTPPSNKGLTVKTEDGQFLVVRSLGDKGIEIATEDNERVDKFKVFVLPPKNPDFLEGCRDLTALSYLHEPAVLHNLKVRYVKDEIYTFTGAILIALNPWKPVPALYAEDVMRQYATATTTASSEDPVPHVYHVANVAYQTLKDTHESQTILVSGESGAGKTENCKILMRFLAMTTGSYQHVGEIEQRLLESNPILEAFGNARTLRNDNSSRFGKFIEIHFSDVGRIVGAKIETYLLEKSRLTRLGPGDRNFHILYQLLAGADEADRDALHLRDPQSYRYLNQSEIYTIDGHSEAADFKETRHAMDVMGISGKEQEAIFRIVASILHLGNLKFVADNKDAAVLDTSAHEEDVSVVTAGLLKIEAPSLVMALTQKKIFVGGEYLTQALRIEQAVDARDALAKALYARLFQWLVTRINSSIHKDADSDCFIGILDIFGFEYFQENSFEQLCINYANEKIQQLFNTHIFKMEQKEYAKEQIKWAYVDFKDNQIVLDLIEDKPNGLLAVLDEECMLPKGTDEGFVQKLLTRCNPAVIGKNRFSAHGFVVKHFAGEVNYDSYQFLNKNRDALHADLVPCIQQSKDMFIKSLFPSSMFHREAMAQKRKSLSAPRPSASPDMGTKIFQVTVGTQFKEALKDLALKIWSTTPYFVRCIKPNSIKKPKVFDNNEVATQLNCAGVFEAIRIMRDMYPSRITHDEFYKRFTTHEWRCIIAAGKNAGLFRPLPSNNFDDFEALRLSCSALCQALSLADDSFQVGRSKVFFRTGVLAQQEERLQRYIFLSASKIRARYLGWVLRRQFVKNRAATLVLQQAIRSTLAKSLVARKRNDRAARKIQSAWRKTRLTSGFRKVVYEVMRRHRQKLRLIEVEKKRDEAATRIQTAYRRHVHRKRFVAFRKAVVAIQAHQRGHKVRATNKINKAVNIVEEKKRLERENASLHEQIAQLRRELEASVQKGEALDERNTQLAGELATTTEGLNATKVAKNRLEEKAAALASELADTQGKLASESAAKLALGQEHAALTAALAELTAAHAALKDLRETLELNLRTTQEQFAADKVRLESELAFTKRELEEEQTQKTQVFSKLNLEKGTVGALETVIGTLKAGLGKAARQAKHIQEQAKLEAASLKANLERELFVEVSVLKKALLDSWKVQQQLRDEKGDLENDIDEIEKRMENVVEDLINIEKQLAAETEAHWRTADQKKALEKQVATGASLFSALDSKRERLERDLDEKNKDIAALKASLARQSKPTGTIGRSGGSTASFFGQGDHWSDSGLISSRRKRPAMVQRITSAVDTAFEADRVTKSGWLTKDRKKGDADKRQSKWERRFLVLKSTSAAYYEDQEMKKLKGDIPLDACFVSEDATYRSSSTSGTSGEPCLKLVTGGRTLYFMADTPEQTRQWVSAIKVNIAFNAYLKKTLMVSKSGGAQGGAARVDPRVGEFVQNYHSVEALVLEGEPLTLEAMVALQAPIVDALRLTTISFEEANMNDLEVQVFADAASGHKTLRAINLAKNGVTDAGAKYLAGALAKNTALTTLSLTDNKIKTDGADALAKLLKALPALARLDLDENAIGDAGVIALCVALTSDAKHPAPLVNFSATGMTDKACEAVAALVRANGTVVDLFLAHNAIGDAGAVAVAKALERGDAAAVQTIDLSSNQINTAGVVALAKMLEVNPRILSLSIGGNRFSSGKEVSGVLATVAADSKLVFPLLAFERQAA